MTEELARRARTSVLQMCSRTRASAHMESELAVIDVLAVLYGYSADVSPSRAADPDCDVILVSPNHHAAALYATLANAGYFPTEWLDRYRADPSLLGGHLAEHTTSGVGQSPSDSVGTLGRAVEIALENRRCGLHNRVFAVTHDADLASTDDRHAALVAAQQRLDNLTVVIDCAQLEIRSGPDSNSDEPVADRWRNCGWDVREVSGRNHLELRAALEYSTLARPLAVVTYGTSHARLVPTG